MLEGKVALVTGAAKRLGRAIALALGNAGADVVVHYRHSKAEAEQTAAEIQSLGVNCSAMPAELTSADDVRALFARIADEFGRLDVLINNVSFLAFKPWDELSPAEWQAGLDPLTASFLCCQSAVELMRERGDGRIINIADSSAERLYASPEDTPYRIAKTGTLILTRTLAATETRHGITVNAVSPGTIHDSITKPPIDEIPAARYAEYDDVTNAILWLLRPESAYVSGANIKVSGGWDL